VRCSARRLAGGGDGGCRVIGRCRTRHGQTDAHAEADGAACQGESGQRSLEFHILLSFLGVCRETTRPRQPWSLLRPRWEIAGYRAKADEVASDTSIATRFSGRDAPATTCSLVFG
jgi:hypothetical protein